MPTALIVFEGEQHGFRTADAIRCAYDAELWFYGRVLGFTPSGIGVDVQLPAVSNVVSANVE